MSNSRYALRSALFVVAYLAAFLIAAVTPFSPLSPLVVGAIWLTAQTGHARRRFDVIMLATVAAVAATLTGAGLLMAATLAISAVVPALVFAVLLERRLPGYWLGHGDRFRHPRVALGPLVGAAALTAAAGGVLSGVIDPAVDPIAVPAYLVRDAVVLTLVTLGVRGARRARSPQRSGLTVVR